MDALASKLEDLTHDLLHGAIATVENWADLDGGCF